MPARPSSPPAEGAPSGADPAAAGRTAGDPCPACAAPLRVWRTAPSGEPTLPADVPLLRCDACGAAVTGGPPPGFAAVHDAGGYATRRPRGAGLATPLLAAFDRARLRRVGRPSGDARLLDVGAGRGRFVAAARAAGWDAHGLEPSARGVEAARDVHAVVLEQRGIEAYAPASPVDAITLWHVLEHLDDPAAALARIATWVRPGGRVLVGVPNLASWQARVGGPRWFHLDLPRHRVHLTPVAVRHLLDGAGLDVVRVDHGQLEHNPFGLWQSLVNRASGTTSHLFQLLKRAEAPRPGALLWTVALLPALPIALLAEALAGALGRGGTIAVLARRPVDGPGRAPAPRPGPDRGPGRVGR